MRKLYKYIASSIISGFLFLIPLGIVFIIFEKVFKVLRRTLIAFDLNNEETSFFYIFLNNLIIILCIVFVCFLAGFIAKLAWGTRLIAFIETNILSHIPGYYYVKASAEDLLDVPSHNFQEVILFRHGENLQIGFTVESITATKVMIFIPIVPKPRSGSMFIVDKAQLIQTDMPTHTALALMRSMGTGAALILSRYINEKPPQETDKQDT